MTRIKRSRDKALNAEEEQVFEELTSQGVGSGLESELTDDEGSIKAPFDPARIDVITQGRTVDLLLTRLKEGELDLSPDFQRRGNLWNEARKSSLIESLLLRIPIPSLYVSEDKHGDYAVVDGLQRTCAIAHFVDVNSLNKAVKEKFDPLRLKGLQSLKEYEDCTFSELPRPLQRRIKETELTLHVIRPSTPAEVKFNIFSRINQGGLPLTSQEIRNAIFPGEWRARVRKLARSKAFIKATEGKIKGERMEDHELILRFVALHTLRKGINRPSEQNLDEFLNDFVEHRCLHISDTDWDRIEDDFERAMQYAPLVFGRIAFRKYSEEYESRRPINRGLFESESVVLAGRSEKYLQKLAKNRNELLLSFKKAFKSEKDFANALLYATGRGMASNKRLEVLNRIFDEVCDA